MDTERRLQLIRNVFSIVLFLGLAGLGFFALEHATNEISGAYVLVASYAMVLLIRRISGWDLG